jgi:MFS family permease
MTSITPSPTPDPSPEQRARPGFMRRHAVDLTPLKVSRDFRRLFVGQAVSEVGTEITLVALPFQVYALTRSTLAVGLLGLCELVPMFALSIVGGAMADAIERRRVLLVVHAILALLSLGLAANAAADSPAVWPLYAFAAAAASGWALVAPALRAWPARLVGPELLPSAFALGWGYSSVAMLLGPALGGVLIGAIGLTGVYLFDVASFGVALVALWSMRPSPPAEDSPPFGLGAIREGLRSLKGKRVLQCTYLADLNAMVFGMPMALFPAVGERLGGGSRLVGLLYAAPAAGALVASLFSGRARHVRRQGRAILIAVSVWGAAIVAFGLAGSAPFALVFLAVAGGADTVSGIYRDSVAQRVVDERMRGRIAGIGMSVWTSGPALGNVKSGIVASAFGLTFSIVSGGLACIAGAAAIAWLAPAFRRYDAANPAA